jgi:phosphatidylglycerol:prolipoprotein diacylglycerol transferase
VTWDIDPVFLGPWPLPWHALFVVLELAVVGFLVRHYTKHRALTFNELSYLLIVGAAHAFYTVKLAADNPTFNLEIRYYGVFFALGLLLAARAMPLYFERWGFPRSHGEGLTLWTPIGMIIGAHLVHLIFYEPRSFIDNPIRIIQIGSGLASHGGGLGAILAVIFFSRRHGGNALRYMDPAMCAATWVIPWVRVGNWFNSEIVGREWDGPWAVRFPRHDCPGYPEFVQQCDAPLRHPSQIYEAILAFIMVGIAVYLQRTWRNRLRPGAILFTLLGYYFTTRFLIEYVKELQAGTDVPLLTMGQILSIPIVLVCAYMLFFSKTSNILKPLTAEELASYQPKPRGPKPARPAKPTPEVSTAPEPTRDAADEGAEPTAPPADDAPASRPKKRKKKK